MEIDRQWTSQEGNSGPPQAYKAVLREDNTTTSEKHRCGHCGEPEKDKKLLVCGDCFEAGRHKLPELFTTRFCSPTCYWMAMKSSHSLIHRKLSIEQLDYIVNSNGIP